MNPQVMISSSRPLLRRTASLCALLLSLGAAGTAQAQDEEDEKGSPEDARKDKLEGGAALGLAPGIPQASALPGGFTPAYSSDAEDEGTWGADFHGFIAMPLKLGFNNRAGNVTNEQFSTVIHSPPVVPEYRDAFTFTSALPEPYVQLNFAYGNKIVQANVIVQARAAATAMSFFDASTRGGITDAFLTFNPPDLAKNVSLLVHVGAFTNRYGAMGEYDEGRYGTPIIARTNGMGENIVARLDLGDWNLELEQGFQGQVNNAPLGIVPGDWNSYADPNIGTGLVHHVHAGLGYKDVGHLGLHYMMAWTADDRANQGTLPDGKIHILGADTRFHLKRYGHLYVGASYTDAQNSRSVGRIVEVMNSLGGPGLIRNYLGPNSGGTGQLITAGGQYDLSLARAIYGEAFEGKSPDVFLSAFAIATQVFSDDSAYNDVSKLKFGGEAGYSLLSWFATSLRFDHVQPNLARGAQAFSILSPRLIFRSNWKSRDQVTLQYSHWFNGDDVVVRSGTPAIDDPSVRPDEDVVSLSATMWW